MTARPALLALAAVAGAVLFAPEAAAQSLNLDFGDPGGSATGRIIQLIALITVLSLAPSILVMMTSFTRIVVVLSFLRTALGTMGAPPNVVLISLALFLTAFVMAPTLQQVYDDGLQPLIEGRIDEGEAFERSIQPVRRFMLEHVRERDLELFVNISNSGPVASVEEVGLQALVPAFMISELRRAFEIGFLLFVPFLIIDMVVAS
ncbi:MAG: flagellar type III secretion system pore protein FliP, partial [Acetobacterales bacterium]